MGSPTCSSFNSLNSFAPLKKKQMLKIPKNIIPNADRIPRTIMLNAAEMMNRPILMIQNARDNPNMIFRV